MDDDDESSQCGCGLWLAVLILDGVRDTLNFYAEQNSDVKSRKAEEFVDQSLMMSWRGFQNARIVIRVRGSCS